MNFQNVDIPVLAKFISEITGKNFIIDESVRGKVTIISPSKVTPDQAYSLFQSVLQIKGFTTVLAGKVIKIVPARNVRSDAPLTESQLPADLHGDEYVTRMVKLKNVDAASLVGVVQPMVSHDGLVAAYPEDNTLIITDDAYNVQRLLQIIGSLDIQGVQANVAVIPLKLAFAGELAPEIEQIMAARSGSTSTPQGPRPGMGVVAPTASGPSGGFKVIPDERTNSLIVLAGPLQLREIKDVVAKLDIVPPNVTSRIHVYRLKNAQALEMVQVMNNLLNGGSSPSTLSPQTGRGSLGRGSSLGMMGGGMGGMGGGMGGGFGGMGGMSGGYGGSSMGGMGGGMGGGMMSSMGGMGGVSGGMGSGMGMMSGNSSGNTGSASASTSGGKGSNFTNPVNITADPATNALVVSASPQDWQTLKQIIDELDVPRVQVFVQAVIVEVSAERSRQLGVEFNASTGISNSTIGLGTMNYGNLQNALGNPLGLSGLGLGLASGSLCSVPSTLAAGVASTGTVGAAAASTITIPCDLALLEALETDTHSNVLSAPTLLTADNEEAMIVVGQNLPFVGSASANAGLPGQIFNSVERQNVGITLDIVPQVSEGDYVKLDLYEEVSNVVGSTVNNPLGPTTTIRSASTSVMVQNHRTAVIGGLLSSQDSASKQGIPYISDIPVIGNLFSFKQTDRQKDNLIVFLTPHVIRNRTQLRALALDERHKFIQSIGRKEVHDMPASQIHELYKPSFSIAVPPSADLGAPSSASAPPGAPSAADIPPPPSTPRSPSGDTPFNTEEIGPSSMRAPTGTIPGTSGPAVPVASGDPSAGIMPSSRAFDATRVGMAPATP
ncbi:MAG TPA: type II secretion system secretin GspD [Candidatus Binataceae bacterium]|nr:type II secretion system secretin GspD [Candidatus Binataceae bacterium]